MNHRFLLGLTILPILAGCGGLLAPDPSQDTPAAPRAGEPSPQPAPLLGSVGGDGGAGDVGGSTTDGGTVGTGPSDVLWTSDDGPILGLALDGDRVLAVTQSEVTSIARDGSARPKVLARSAGAYLYDGAIEVRDGTVFVGSGGGVWSVPRDGGTSVEIGAEGYSTAGIALDDTNVYWMTNDAVMKAPRAGGATTKLATLAGVSYEDAFTMVGQDLYWSTNSSTAGGDAALYRLAAGASAPEVVAPGPVFSVKPNGRGGVAWLEDPTPVIVTSSEPSAPRIFLGGWVDEFATDGALWYWRDDGTGVFSVMGAGDAAPRALTAPEHAATANNGNGRHTLMDSTAIVWASRTGPIMYEPDVDVVRVMLLPQNTK